ncbi:MAG: signal peptidase II [Acidimicrobiales bacterium]
MAVAVVGLDQVTKTLALHYLDKGPTHVIGPLSLDLTFNSGAAFSLGTGFSPLLAAVAVVLIVILWRAGRSAVAALSCVGIGLVLGGAVGNLVDRLLRSNGGAVIDFVDFRFWPTFNLADSCIVIGVGLLIWTGLRQKTR